jgi:MtN3 and saliva related transmembrane protein
MKLFELNLFKLKLVNIIGYFAAICTTIAFIPQVIKVWETGNTDGISLYMYLIFIIGIISWFIYGVFIKSNEIIFANIITLPLAIYILYHVIKNNN